MSEPKFPTVSAPASLLIVDDHEIFREGLVALLSREREFKVVAQVSDGKTALEKLVILKPQVAVIDVSLPDMNGAELARKIRNRLPNTRIVALSMHAEPQFIELMLKAGATAYVLKNDAFKELITAIQHSCKDNGRVYLSQTAVKTGMGQDQGRPRISVGKKGLSKREEEVLRMLASGKKSREIAECLDISAKTVDTYRRRVMDKLGVDNQADLVKRAISLGLTTLG